MGATERARKVAGPAQEEGQLFVFQHGPIGAGVYGSHQGVILRDFDADGAAAKLGMPPGSVLCAINGRSVAQLDSAAVVALLAGASWPVTLTITPPSSS